MANITEPEVYMKRIADILGDEFVDGKLQPALDISSVDEANLQTEKIDQQQEQLKQIKAEAKRLDKLFDAEWNSLLSVVNDENIDLETFCERYEAFRAKQEKANEMLMLQT